MFSLINYFFSKSNASQLDLQIKNPNKSDLSLNILFDYKKDIKIYLHRCKPVLEEMIKCGLVQKFLNCKSVDDFDFKETNKKYFNANDFEDIIYARSILEKPVSFSRYWAWNG
jgi:hypothetical protein